MRVQTVIFVANIHISRILQGSNCGTGEQELAKFLEHKVIKLIMCTRLIIILTAFNVRIHEFKDIFVHFENSPCIWPREETIMWFWLFFPVAMLCMIDGCWDLKLMTTTGLSPQQSFVHNDKPALVTWKQYLHTCRESSKLQMYSDEKKAHWHYVYMLMR